MPAKRTLLLVSCAVTIGAMALCLLAALLARRWASSRPDWSFAFPYDGRAVADMHFSPNGRSLAVVSADDHTYSNQATWIYEVPSGSLRHQIEGGGMAMPVEY
jgi:hypothetical protein